jgi:hypothetical protein
MTRPKPRFTRQHWRPGSCTLDFDPTLVLVEEKTAHKLSKIRLDTSSTSSHDMKLLNSVAVCITVFASSAMAGNGLRGELNDENMEPVARSVKSGHRDLQLLDILCPLVTGLVPGGPVCQCGFQGLAFAFTCAFEKPLCVGGKTGFCAVPTIIGELDYFGMSARFQFCASGATNGGNPVPGLCINVGAAVIGNALGGDSTVDLQTCTATIDGNACSSCEICDAGTGAGTGYTFNCAKIDEQMVQSECTPLHILSSFSKDQGDIQFMPHLDKV